MREHPLVPTLRLLLLSVAALCLLPWLPTESGLLLATGFGWWPGCACCTAPAACPHCSPDYSNDFQVTILGITNGTCTDCTNMNSTFTIQQNALSKCIWSHAFSTTVCGTATFTPEVITSLSGSTMHYTGELVFTCSGVGAVFYEQDNGTNYDCSALSGFNVAFNSATGACVGKCTVAASTFTITAT